MNEQRSYKSDGTALQPRNSSPDGLRSPFKITVFVLAMFIYGFNPYGVLKWNISHSTRGRLYDTGKWNQSDFRPLLCTYRLNWARRTSWGWWDDWDDTVLQTQDSKFEPWRSLAEHATSRSRRLPTILTFTRGWGRNIFCSFKPPTETGNRTPNSSVKGSGANHYPRAPAHMTQGNQGFVVRYFPIETGQAIWHRKLPVIKSQGFAVRYIP